MLFAAALIVTAMLFPAQSMAQSRMWDYSGQKLGVGGDLGLGVASSNVGVGFQWGVNTKFKILRDYGFYITPGFMMYVKSGAWQMTITPAPIYQFRFRKFPVHPYAGLCPNFHITHAGNQTNARMGIHWNWGAEWLITPEIGLYNDYKFQLVFKSPDVFTITAGMTYYVM
jgi:hypothetical protein